MKELEPADVLDLAMKSDLRGRGGAGFPDRPQVVVLAEQRPAALPGVQLRRSRARHVQRPHAARRDAASDHRGHPDRRVRDRLRTTRSSISAASSSAATRSFATALEAGARGRLRRQEHLRQRLRSSKFTIHRGAGAYICGEETGAAQLARRQARRAAAQAAVPGDRRASTASRPSSTTSRRWRICRTSCERGAEWFAAVGTERSQGYKIVSVSRPRAEARQLRDCRSARRSAS